MLKDIGEYFVLVLLGMIFILNIWRVEVVRKDYFSYKCMILVFFYLNILRRGY